VIAVNNPIMGLVRLSEEFSSAKLKVDPENLTDWLQSAGIQDTEVDLASYFAQVLPSVLTKERQEVYVTENNERLYSTVEWWQALMEKFVEPEMSLFGMQWFDPIIIFSEE
jgi:hypothetical protein